MDFLSTSSFVAGITTSFFPSIILIIILSFISIILAFAYFYLTEAFSSNVVLPRLTKASFKLDHFTVINLWGAYFVSSFAFAIIYYILPKMFNVAASNKSVSIHMVVILGLFVIFLGRIIAKYNGVLQSRVYYSTLLTFAFLLIVITVFTNTATGSWHGVILKSPDSFSKIMQPLFANFLLGAFLLATVGETCLSLIKPPKRSLNSITEKLPYDFYPVTGLQESGFRCLKDEIAGEHHGVEDKLTKILIKKKIKIIKCFSRSLWVVEKVNKIDGELKLGLHDKVYVIKLPDDIAREKIAKQIFERNHSLDYRSGERVSEFNEDWKKYNDNLDILEKYKHISHDIGDLRFIITEYEDRERNIMFLTRDASPLGNIIGIFSEEAYVIELFSNMFDRIWGEHAVETLINSHDIDASILSHESNVKDPQNENAYDVGK